MITCVSILSCVRVGGGWEVRNKVQIFHIRHAGRHHSPTNHHVKRRKVYQCLQHLFSLLCTDRNEY